MRVAEQPLGLAIGLHETHLRLVASRQTQIPQGGCVHREKAGRGPEFRGHVGYGGPVGHGQGVQAGSEEFHQRTHHALGAQQVGDGEHEVRGRGPVRQPSRQLSRPMTRGVSMA